MALDDNIHGRAVAQIGRGGRLNIELSAVGKILPGRVGVEAEVSAAVEVVCPEQEERSQQCGEESSQAFAHPRRS